MKKFLNSLVVLLLMAGAGHAAVPTVSPAPPVVLKWDGKPQTDVRNLRTTDDADAGVDRRGLDKLHASGSDQFTLEGLQDIAHRLAGHPVIVVDLREEPHGFLNGQPLSWYGPQNHADLHEDAASVQRDEHRRLSRLHRGSEARVFLKGPKTAEGVPSFQKSETVPVHDVETEKDAVRKMGWQYLRLPVPDHMRPDDPVVDQFVAFARDLPADRWVHFHCAGGRGRTSTFLTMWDILHNAGDVPLQTILLRQKDLGGEDLTAMPAKDSPHYGWTVDRLNFVKAFYQYCAENRAGRYAVTWSRWLAAHPQAAPAVTSPE